MRVCVTGGRDFTSHEQRMWLYAGLNMLDEISGGILEIIEGGARGADLAAKNWAMWKKACDRKRIIKITTVDAQWEKYSVGLKHGQKNPAGLIRNNQMVALRPDVVLACPGGPGTAHMVAASKKAGLKVIFLEKMPVAKGPPGASSVPEGPRPQPEIKQLG
jgi:hypothetical protein